jgi:hypothetical protein
VTRIINALVWISRRHFAWAFMWAGFAADQCVMVAYGGSPATLRACASIACAGVLCGLELGRAAAKGKVGE